MLPSEIGALAWNGLTENISLATIAQVVNIAGTKGAIEGLPRSALVITARGAHHEAARGIEPDVSA